jgi:hypothetical protein
MNPRKECVTLRVAETVRGIWIYAALERMVSTNVCGPLGGIYPYPSQTAAELGKY